MFRALGELMGEPQLADDPRFQSNEARMANVEALEALITGWTATLSAAELVAKLEAIGVPCAKVARVSELVDDPHLAHRGMILDMQHPKAGRVPMQGFSVQFGASPMRLRQAPPMLGEHTDSVLREWLELPEERIAELRANAVV
jgi:crotonobetainyl-CoA:carnitine CoA-transferase CaiB-like acyl-CoA transferase